MTRARKNEEMTFRDAIFVGLVHRYLRWVKHSGVRFVHPLVFHPLLYFAQERGEPLGLQFVRSPIGPYAENLLSTFRVSLDHLLLAKDERGYVLAPGAARAAVRVLESEEHSATREILDGVCGMFWCGPAAASLAHWMLFHEEVSASSIDELAEQVYDRLFDPQKDRHRLALIRSCLRMFIWMKQGGDDGEEPAWQPPWYVPPPPPAEPVKLTNRDKKWLRLLHDSDLIEETWWPRRNPGPSPYDGVVAKHHGVSRALVQKVRLLIAVALDGRMKVCPQFIARRQGTTVEMVEKLLKKSHLYELGTCDDEETWAKIMAE